MTKHIGNRIGIALTAGGGGMWNIYNQFFYQKQGSWPAYVPPPPLALLLNTCTGTPFCPTNILIISPFLRKVLI